MSELATKKQKNYLRILGYEGDTSGLPRHVASSLITDLKGKRERGRYSRADRGPRFRTGKD